MIKNKKFFGILNLPDIIVIGLVLVIVLPLVHFYMKFNEKGFAEQKKIERFIGQKARNDIVYRTAWRTRMLDVDVSFKNLTEEALGKIKVGDRELQPDGTVAAEVLWIGNPVPNYFIVDLGTLTDSLFVKTVPGDGLYSMPAKIRITGVVANSGLFSRKDRNVKELAEFKFESKDYDAYYVVEMPPIIKSQD